MKKIAADRNYKLAKAPDPGVKAVGDIIRPALTDALGAIEKIESNPQIVLSNDNPADLFLQNRLGDIKLSVQIALNASSTL